MFESLSKAIGINIFNIACLEFTGPNTGVALLNVTIQDCINSGVINSSAKLQLSNGCDFIPAAMVFGGQIMAIRVFGSDSEKFYFEMV